MGVVAKLHEMPKRLEPEGTQSPGKITITLDVTELGPIELEVKGLGRAMLLLILFVFFQVLYYFANV